jgi:hypothetical protein
MLRTPSPPLRSLVEDVTPMGKSGFRALAGPLKQVWWPEKFKTGNIDRYDGSNNPEEFIQVYQTIIEAVGGGDWVNANFLPTTLTACGQIMAHQSARRICHFMGLIVCHVHRELTGHV